MSNESTNTPEKRTFRFNGMVLDDPDPNMTPEKVIEFYTPLHAELNNSVLKGPSIGADGTKTYKIEVKIGDNN